MKQEERKKFVALNYLSSDCGIPVTCKANIFKNFLGANKMLLYISNNMVIRYVILGQ